MALEIERKFLVTDPACIAGVSGQTMQQGYVMTSAQGVVRVRTAGDQAWLTIKGRNQGLARSEFEYPIPLIDGQALLAEFCQGALIEKERFRCVVGQHVWEIDVFSGANSGLIVAEIELSSVDEDFVKPPWLGCEVSSDPRYYNQNLLKNPYKSWS